MGKTRLMRRSLYFTAPGALEIRQEPLSPPAPGQVLIETILSAISPGSEMLIYRGQFPKDLAVDENISALGGAFRYPLQYGYAAVGRVIALGVGVEAAWRDRLVFAFNPHESHFNASPAQLQLVPDDLHPEQAVFLPNMETALNLIMDGAPLVGERVAVFGQGIVGLLTAALLAQFPLEGLVTFDCHPNRRGASLELGVQASLDPAAPEILSRAREILSGEADLTYELSGAPEALDQAIGLTGFDGRVVVGSWYGEKRASLDLGGRFHRSRIRLISSQVSTLAPALSGRWTKERRFQLAWEMIRRIKPGRWITQRFALDQATQAYDLLDHRPGECIQVMLSY
jgi:2-desacetyl-2-hydroxyethyl bacteriochlorophyllide A dehydrogenase